ncbi:MAG: hypothetical protein K0Q53_346 [Massilibacillus sp.]|jgi:hypothetical protein|nr:hypothetical protein [Massilibacillus sp.]
MVELKDRMSKHVKAAKAWLGRAEQSFDKEQNIRGELDLMLAQAELKRAQESRVENKKQYNKYRLIHSILAACIAGLVVVVGFSGWEFLNGKPAINTFSHVNKVEQVNNEILDKNQNMSINDMDKPMQMVEKKVDVPIAASKVTKVNQESETKSKIEEKPSTASTVKEDVVNLPPAQMQNLMRAAGKSLRGQE